MNEPNKMGSTVTCGTHPVILFPVASRALPPWSLRPQDVSAWIRINLQMFYSSRLGCPLRTRRRMPGPLFAVGVGVISWGEVGVGVGSACVGDATGSGVAPALSVGSGSGVSLSVVGRRTGVNVGVTSCGVGAFAVAEALIDVAVGVYVPKFSVGVAIRVSGTTSVGNSGLGVGDGRTVLPVGCETGVGVTKWMGIEV